MSDLLGNPDDQFSRIQAQIFLPPFLQNQRCHVSVQYEEDPADFYDVAVEKMPTPVPQGRPRGEYFMMEEEVDIVEVDEVERIEVPRFDECRRSVVIHDFRMVS